MSTKLTIVQRRRGDHITYQIIDVKNYSHGENVLLSSERCDGILYLTLRCNLKCLDFQSIFGLSWWCFGTASTSAVLPGKWRSPGVVQVHDCAHDESSNSSVILLNSLGWKQSFGTVMTAKKIVMFLNARCNKQRSRMSMNCRSVPHCREFFLNDNHNTKIMLNYLIMYLLYFVHNFVSYQVVIESKGNCTWSFTIIMLRLCVLRWGPMWWGSPSLQSEVDVFVVVCETSSHTLTSHSVSSCAHEILKLNSTVGHIETILVWFNVRFTCEEGKITFRCCVHIPAVDFIRVCQQPNTLTSLCHTFQTKNQAHKN